MTALAHSTATEMELDDEAKMRQRAAEMAELERLIDEETPDEESDELAWQDRALCAQTDPNAFFPEKGESLKSAKAVCGACPVRGECLEYALNNKMRFGIWGGLSERERRDLLAQEKSR